MDFDRLQSFIRVAEVGSLSGASDVLRIAQPALSRQIRLLEAEVGQQLFIRSHAGMRLTPAGEALLSRVSGLMRQLEQGVEEVRAFADEPVGEVRIGMVPTVAAVVAEPLVLRVARELPKVRLRITEGYTSHILDWLHRREADIGVVYGPAADLHLRARPLCRDELVLIAPKGEGPATAPAGLADLAGRPLVLPSSHHGLRMVIEKAAECAGIGLDIPFEVSSFVTILQLVAAGVGWTVQPRSIVPEFVSPARFDVLGFRPRLSRQVILAEPPGPAPARAVRALSEIVAAETEKRLRLPAGPSV